MGKKLLTGKDIRMFGMNPDELTIIGIDTEHTEGEHPLWDKRIELPIDEGLVRNIEKFGVVEPVIARVTRGDNVAEIVDGRRRVRHARIANERLREKGEEIKLIPTIARRQRVGDDMEMVSLMILANEQRTDDTMLGRSRKLAQLFSMGATDKDAAVVFTVTATAIRNWKKLLKCDEKVLEAIDRGELKASAAADLGALPLEEQVEKLEELKTEAAKTGKTTVTTAQTSRVRRQRTDSIAATAFVPPRKPVLKGVLKLAGTEGAPALNDQALGVLKWVLGEADASGVPGLAEALTLLEKSKNDKKLKISAPQQEIIEKLKAGPELASSLNRKITNAMVKKNLVEIFTPDDGVEHMRLTAAYTATLAGESAQAGQTA